MFCDGVGYGSRFSGMHNFGGGSFIVGLIIIIALVFLVLEIIKASKKNNNNDFTGSSSNALHILEEEYALGKIDRQEFEERRSVLKGR